MARLTYQQLIDKHIQILKDLQTKSGLFLASSSEVTTGYDKSKALENVIDKLKEQHPNLHIELSPTAGEIMKIRFEVSRDRTLFIDISEKTLDSKYGAV
jgi:DNA-binding transcriptional LysR family regulator